MPFASQMFADFRMSPYESELSTDSFKNHQPLSYLNWSSYKERRVDALALRADERRDILGLSFLQMIVLSSILYEVFKVRFSDCFTSH